MNAQVISPELRARYIKEIALPCRNDPWRWVMTAYPWGEKGTPLEDKCDAAGVIEQKRPYKWQEKILKKIRDDLQAMEAGEIPIGPIRIAAKAGHGPGKSALIGWLNDWNVSTQPDARGTTTANTDQQLRDKTWPELQKWHRMSISRHFFNCSATTLRSTQPGHETNWAATAIPWSERIPEAIAGLHNAGNRVLLVFDEASAIPPIIWETVQGAMTDKDTIVIWLVCGNPTRNSGPFYACWNKFAALWYTITVDSRDVPGTNKELFKEWIRVYGEDSDFCRIRIYGQWPAKSAMQFIGRDIVDAAMAREPNCLDDDPLICGIDLARQGNCASVLYWRKGRDAQTWKPDVYPDDPSSSHFIAKCAGRLREMKPDLIYGDSVGVGGPILDRLRELGFPVIDVGGGDRAVENERHFNRRAELWARGKEWIRDGGALWKDEGFATELCTIELVPNTKGLTQLESKEHLLARGEKSPDTTDGFMLTHAYECTAMASAEAQIKHGTRNADASFDQWADLKDAERDDYVDIDPAARNRRHDLSRHYSGDR